MWHEARKQEKKIRGMMVDYKRRAERRREYYEKIKQDPAQFLQVHGRPAKIHLDPAVALAADSPATMMPWQGHADNLIDRFDVRAHLDIIPEFKSTAEFPKVSYDEEDRKTCYERYRTLVQNDFLGVNEDKFLHQIFMEERYGIFKPGCEEEKKKLADKKAAIGYVYEDSTESPPRSTKILEDDEDENEEDKDDDLSDLDLDVTVDVSVLTSSQCAEMNAQSIKFGMVDDDFITYLLQDKEEAEQLKLAREIEEEKAMYSGRKSRRERRALREKKLAGRKITSPPSYAARDSPTYTPMRHSTSKSRSRSRSPPDAGKIMFITSFGDEGSDAEQRSKVSEKGSQPISKHGKNFDSKSKDGSSGVIGPQLPSKNGESSKNSISSDSSRSSGRTKQKSSRSRRYTHRRSKRSKSRSRSSSVSSKKSNSKSKKHCRKNISRSRSRSLSVSHSRSRSRSGARSQSNKTKSRSSSRSRSRSKSSAPKTNTDKSASPQLPPPPVKSYYRHSLSRSNSEFSDDSEEDKSSNKSSSASTLPTTSRLQQLMGKAPPATKTKLTPQERLKRKMQLALKKQYKADKKAQMEKTEKQLQERQDRAEELREMAIKLRQRERERRHRMRGYGYDSDSDTTWTRNPDYNPRTSEGHHSSRRTEQSSSRSESSESSEQDHSPPPESYSSRRRSRSRSRSKSTPRSSRRSPVHEKRHSSPSFRSSRRSPVRRSPRRSPHRSYRRSPVRNSYGSRDARRGSSRRRSISRSPSRRYSSSRHYRYNYSHSRSKSPVSKPYSSKPLVDY